MTEVIVLNDISDFQQDDQDVDETAYNEDKKDRMEEIDLDGIILMID